MSLVTFGSYYYNSGLPVPKTSVICCRSTPILFILFISGNVLGHLWFLLLQQRATCAQNLSDLLQKHTYSFYFWKCPWSPLVLTITTAGYLCPKPQRFAVEAQLFFLFFYFCSWNWNPTGPLPTKTSISSAVAASPCTLRRSRL